jgi:hypothetical protein
MGTLMNPSELSQEAVVSEPPWEALERRLIVEFGNYAIASREFRKRESLTPEFRTTGSCSATYQKSQTLSDKFRKRSTPSMELLQPKIQTVSGKFRRRCLRNSESTARPAAVARGASADILRPAHPPSLWLCRAQMWRVFRFHVLVRGGRL